MVCGRFIMYLDFERDIKNVFQSLHEIAAELRAENVIDFVEISGSDSVEQKSFTIDLFCDNVTEPEEKELMSLYHGLVATSGSASTGIDPPNIEVVSCKGLPPSATTTFQELGCLLRGYSADNGPYLYHITINIGSYAGLLLRSETTAKVARDEKDRNLRDHFVMMLVLDAVCLPYAFEKMFGQPGSSDLLDDNCGGKCPVSSGKQNNECAPLHIWPLQRALTAVFL
jgi:hypothetical protein